MTVQDIINLRDPDRDTIVAPQSQVGYTQAKLLYQNSKLLQKLYPKGVEELIDSGYLR